MESNSKIDRLKISCLGGIGEIGKNLYVYETDDNAVILDYGIMFADTDKCGVDYILPDPAYLLSIKDKLRGIVYTHGHEDHIGGAVYIHNLLSLPVYTGNFTRELLDKKFQNEKHPPLINVVQDGDKLELGDILLQFVPVAHSIPDTFGIVITTQNFSCLHISDFKCNVDGNISYHDKVDCMLLDSTNALSRSKSGLTEGDIAAELEKLCAKDHRSIFFTTFASNVMRIASVVNAAKKTGRKIVIEGGAMERTVGIASRLGMINLKDDDTVDIRHAPKQDQLLYIASGCQGEPRSALYTIVFGERRSVKVEKGDLLIFSSRAIPGNDRNINAIINEASRRGAKVIEANDATVHLSGHAYPDELTNVISNGKPRYFIPIHGEYRHLVANAELAESLGVPEVIIFTKGEQAVFEDGVYKSTDPIPFGNIYIDNRGGYKLTEDEMTVRQQISRDGVVVVRISESDYTVESYGFTLNEEQLKTLLYDLHNSDIIEGETEQERVKRRTKRFFRKYLYRRPHIVV